MCDQRCRFGHEPDYAKNTKLNVIKLCGELEHEQRTYQMWIQMTSFQITEQDAGLGGGLRSQSTFLFR